ncbi:Imm49 family immunity protein [Kribbella ginsengisoli]|uniref:Uncharacterized protein n=1 Tax=Kribbella ginsengisoli TaxID=363865 RepID=A0ABP6WYY2_9ACTN
MTVTIDRHGPRDDLTWFQEYLDDLDPLEWQIEALGTRPQHVKLVMTDAAKELGLRQLLTPDDERLTDLFELYVRSGAATLARQAAGPGTFTVTLAGQEVELDRATERRDPGFLEKLAALGAAAFDDQQSLELTAAGLGHSTVLHAFHALVTGDPHAGELLRSAIEELDLSHCLLGPWNEHIELPLLKLAQAVLDGGFEEQLVATLGSHRHWYENCEANPGESNARDPLGFVAFGPVCLAAIARQRGIAFAVRSEYLPECLVR